MPEPAELRSQTREVAAAFLATGIDPKTSIIFNQSQLHAHAETAEPKDPAMTQIENRCEDRAKRSL